jgi:hypothetical protein
MGRRPDLEAISWKADIPHNAEYRTPKRLSPWPYVQALYLAKMAKIKTADQGFAQIIHIKILFLALKSAETSGRVGMQIYEYNLVNEQGLGTVTHQLPPRSCNLLSLLVKKG